MNAPQKITKQTDNALSQCNFAKTVLMIMIVACHSIALWMPEGWFNQAPAQSNLLFAVVAEWMGSFHVYSFTLVSGFIFAYLRFEKGKYQAFVPFVKNKAKRLLLPYVFTAVFWAIPVYMYFYDASPMSIINKYVLGQSPSQLWFLLMLFGVFMLAFLGGKKIYDNVYLGCAVAAGLWVIGRGLGLVGFPNYFNILATLQYFIYFYMGMLLWKYGVDFCNKIPKWVYLMVQIALYALTKVIAGRSGMVFKLLSIGLSMVVQMLGALMVFLCLTSLGQWLEEKGCRYRKSKVYLVLEKHNFTIYLVHQQIIYFVIAGLNGKVSSWTLAILSFAVAVLASLGISVALEKGKGLVSRRS